MKRGRTPLTHTPTPHKRKYHAETEDQTLPYKLCLLQNWELSPQASQYLDQSSKAKQPQLQDRTSPQLSIVVYTPLPHQRVYE